MAKHSPWKIDEASRNNPLSAIKELRWISDSNGTRIASMVHIDKATEIVRDHNLMPEIEAFLEELTKTNIGGYYIKQAESLLTKIRGGV